MKQEMPLQEDTPTRHDGLALSIHSNGSQETWDSHAPRARATAS